MEIFVQPRQVNNQKSFTQFLLENYLLIRDFFLKKSSPLKITRIIQKLHQHYDWVSKKLLFLLLSRCITAQVSNPPFSVEWDLTNCENISCLYNQKSWCTFVFFFCVNNIFRVSHSLWSEFYYVVFLNQSKALIHYNFIILLSATSPSLSILYPLYNSVSFSPLYSVQPFFSLYPVLSVPLYIASSDNGLRKLIQIQKYGPGSVKVHFFGEIFLNQRSGNSRYWTRNDTLSSGEKRPVAEKIKGNSVKILLILINALLKHDSNGGHCYK